MRRLLVPLVVFFILAVGSVALDPPERRADLVILNRGDVSTLDLTQMSWLQDFRVASMLMEGLTVLDTSGPGLTPVPGVAESWEVDPSGLVYTFHLRADAKWSDGGRVVSGDFVESWRRALLPENGADYAKLFQLIRGAKEFYEWRVGALAAYASAAHADPERDARALWEETRARLGGIGLVAVDDSTLRVELRHSVPYFLDLTSFPVFAPQHPASFHACESLDPATGAVRTSTEWTQPGKLVSNGAFVLESWRFKRSMRLVKNPWYWDRGRITLRTIEVPSIPDPNAQVLAFREGRVDWTSDVTPPYRSEMLRLKREFLAEHGAEVEAMRAGGMSGAEIDAALPADARNMIHSFPSFGTYFYNFNCRPRLADGRENPFADARVRRAFAAAIDKRAITERVRGIGEPAATTFVPPGSIAGYASPEGVGFDVARARAWLAEAGFEGGKGLPTIELLFNSEGEHDQIAQAVAQDWERNLGVSVRLVQKETRTFREDVKGGRFMVSRASWFGDYGDPTTFLDTNRTGDGNNDRGYSSAAFDGLLARAEVERDVERRMEILSRAEGVLVNDDVPLVPLFQYCQLYLYDPRRVRGISSHPRQVQAFQRLSVGAGGEGGGR